MKVPSNEELEDYTKAISVGGLKGAAVGAGVSTAWVTYARRRLPNYRSYGPFARTFFVMAPVLACGVTAMEFASREFEKRTYASKILAKEAEEEKEKAQLPMKERAINYFVDNKYKIIMGGWAASLAGSFWYINRDKYMTKSQKIVQARMYAQGLTVALLVGSMALSTMSTSEERRKEQQKQDKEAFEEILQMEERRLAKEKH